MKKTFKALLLSSALLLPSISFANFQQIMHSRDNSIITMNMIPTQFQSVVINLENIEDFEVYQKIIEELKTFENYNGNLAGFLSSKNKMLSKNNIYVAAKGSQMLTPEELIKQSKKPKGISFFAEKVGNGIKYKIDYVNKSEDETFSDSGNLGLNKNYFSDHDGYILLISYRTL